MDPLIEDALGAVPQKGQFDALGRGGQKVAVLCVLRWQKRRVAKKCKHHEGKQPW